MSLNNVDLDTDILTTRYRAKRSQSTLNIEIGIMTDTSGLLSGSQTGGGGGNVGGAGEVATVTGGTSPGGASCPEIHQFVLIRSDKNTPISTLAASVETGLYLWSPINHSFEKVIYAETKAADIWLVSDGEIEAQGSNTHPLIHNVNDNVGTPLQSCETGMAALGVINTQVHQCEVQELYFAGKGLVRHLETEGPTHIYCAGSKPDKMFAFHNLKPVVEPE